MVATTPSVPRRVVRGLPAPRVSSALLPASTPPSISQRLSVTDAGGPNAPSPSFPTSGSNTARNAAGTTTTQFKPSSAALHPMMFPRPGRCGPSSDGQHELPGSPTLELTQHQASTSNDRSRADDH